MTEQTASRPAFARTADGARIHVTTCQHARTAKTAVRWVWADDRNSAQIARAVTEMDLQPCRSCKPITVLARWESRQRAARQRTGALPTAAELLEFERAHPANTGRKHEAIRVQFGITAPRYMQLVIAAVATEEALLHDAQLAHQIRDRIARAASNRGALLRRNHA